MSLSGPIFGLGSEHLSIVFRDIGFIRSQTRRNSTTSTIAEANLDITRSIFFPCRQRSTTYRLKRSNNVALFPSGVNSSRLQVEDLFTMFCYFAQVTRHSVQTMLSTKDVFGLFHGLLRYFSFQRLDYREYGMKINFSFFAIRIFSPKTAFEHCFGGFNI